MSLAMRKKIFITAALTGSGSTQDRSDKVPRSPEQIADTAIDAARAGAAVVHCHVRDPETGARPRCALYREVTERIRAAEVDVVLNLTAGMGGDLVFGPTEKPLRLTRKDRHGWCRTGRTCERMSARDLHARLRHDELCRGRLCDDQHARHA